MVSVDSASPTRVPTEATVSPSSSASLLSPITPKSVNENPPRSPEESRQTGANRQTTNAQTQIGNLAPALNALAIDSPQQLSAANKETFREPTEQLVTRNQTSEVQTPPRGNLANVSGTSATNNTTASPAGLGGHSNSSFNSTATPNGVPFNHSLNGTSPLDSSPGSGGRSAAEGARDGVINNTRPTDIQAQRTRRSSRNLEDSSRRRSSRNPRQSTSNAQAVNLVRSGAALARPSLDLPAGYGKFLSKCSSHIVLTNRSQHSK